jgi:hypothetical protein
MGTRSWLSTHYTKSGAQQSVGQSGYAPVFSGKLSPVTTNSEDPIPIEPQLHAASGQKAAAASGQKAAAAPVQQAAAGPAATREVGGRDGPEPTRFGDWELRGRCIDF